MKNSIQTNEIIPVKPVMHLDEHAIRLVVETYEKVKKGNAENQAKTETENKSKSSLFERIWKALTFKKIVFAVGFLIVPTVIYYPLTDEEGKKKLKANLLKKMTTLLDSSGASAIFFNLDKKEDDPEIAELKKQIYEVSETAKQVSEEKKKGDLVIEKYKHETPLDYMRRYIADNGPDTRLKAPLCAPKDSIKSK